MAAEDADELDRNPLECACPECERPKMDGARFCIKCYTENCNAESIYDDGRAKC